MTTNDLTRLRKDAEKIVCKICKSRHKLRLNEAINWAHLHCVQSYFVQTDEGTSYCEVEINSASPSGCPELCAMVSVRLASAGWSDVQVRTEW